MNNEETLKQEIARIKAAGEDRLLVFQLTTPWTRKELKTSYRRLILLFHPDKHTDEDV